MIYMTAQSERKETFDKRVKRFCHENSWQTHDEHGTDCQL